VSTGEESRGVPKVAIARARCFLIVGLVRVDIVDLALAEGE
jgi:hypothetical protein